MHLRENFTLAPVLTPYLLHLLFSGNDDPYKQMGDRLEFYGDALIKLVVTCQLWLNHRSGTAHMHACTPYACVHTDIAHHMMCVHIHTGVTSRELSTSATRRCGL